MNPRGKLGSPQRILELDELLHSFIKRRYQIEGCVLVIFVAPDIAAALKLFMEKNRFLASCFLMGNGLF